MMAAGGVAWERWTSGGRWVWARGLMAAGLLAGGLVFAPMAVPLLSPDGTLTYLHRLGIAPAAQEIGHTSALPQYFADVADAGEAVTPLAVESHIPVRLCRGLRRPLADIWKEYKSFV